ncbi:ribonuclease Z [Cryptococcus wingfieldii CBS 7118]|uniref:Ribonuclease Z n=1 Tax=Cryptococcus wingfieldii CBS 7118 TaxID=1295528 RepID=A0A1E3IVN1_9TREE|nr:ribonuclease Z [Cryptococcus wingfieldii CBS 7118]ODN92673.1 ribonuclease Z [Cryptococcus wingfieldii CBS 7118]
MAATKLKPLPPVSVQFLGTSSGGGPIQSRNCSSLAVDFGNEIWIFDTADGTLGRLHQSSLKVANISRIFITHLHLDHVLGLVPVLTTVMSGVGTTEAETQRVKDQGLKKKANFNIYGPTGLRKMVRSLLQTVHANLSGVFAVHEILHEGEEPSAACGVEDIHTNEAVGSDFRTDSDGVWRDVLQEGNGKGGKGWKVEAGPIHHRIPCLGYVLQEPTPRLSLDTQTLIPLLQSNAAALAERDPPVKHPLSLLSHLTSLPSPPPYQLPSGETISPPEPSGVPPRKIVIFGDCNGGTPNDTFRSMCSDASLLVHECTNAAIPQAIQKGEKGQKVRQRDLESSLVVSRGGVTAGAGKSPSVTHPRPSRWAGEDSNEDTFQNDEEVFADESRAREVIRKAQSRGHSTPNEVGMFARDIKARRVAVNHFSAMFPSPRYSTSHPFPPILSPINSFPYPSPTPLPHTSDPPIPPIPLSSKHSSELHARLIMQSIADQISKHCVSPSVMLEGQEPADICKTGMVVPSRDFMYLPVYSHELTDAEVADVKAHKEVTDKVTREWKVNGGVRLDRGEAADWVGVGNENDVKDARWKFVEEEGSWAAVEIE